MASTTPARYGAAACAASLLALAVPAAQGQEAYPARAVRVVVPYAAGGAVDPLARILSDKLSKQTGQSFYVENKPGAGGRIGIDLVLRSPPDGYNILATPSGVAINPALTPRGSYDLDKDLTPVAIINKTAMLIVTSPQSGIKTLQDLVQRARDKPGSVNYGITGIGTLDHLVDERLRSTQKLDMVRIDYNGVPAALNALLAGEIPVMTIAVSAGMQQARAGKIIPLATTGATRAPLLPDVPTMAEAGVPDFVMYGWSTLLVPSGTPPAITQKLHDEAARAMAQPDYKKMITDVGAEVVELPLPDIKAFVHDSLVLFGDVVRTNNIRVEQ
jgi:tripartite-type tricarboxylate transporter receptor subunit TctC